jgi:spermidine/putrescine-binding protein
MRFTTWILLVVLILTSALAACANQPAQSVELIYRDWENVIPTAVFDAFTKETGIKVNYISYQNQEELIKEIQDGKVYDVVVLETQFIPALVMDGRLAEIDYQNVPNFKNISAHICDQGFDPHNAHSIPYSWGTIGMVVRTDRIKDPVTSWADFWRPEFQGKILGWNLQRYLIGMALKSLGYSLNSEKPAELEAALGKLIEIKQYMTLVDWETAVSGKHLIAGDSVIALGQADDVLLGVKRKVPIEYVLPIEGAILWGDNWSVPANSIHKKEAEQLINFLLQAEVAAQIINETSYWLPNDLALPLVKPEIRDNPAIFPPSENLSKAEVLMPLSPAGQKLYDQIWMRFEAGEN